MGTRRLVRGLRPRSRSRSRSRSPPRNPFRNPRRRSRSPPRSSSRASSPLAASGLAGRLSVPPPPPTPVPLARKTAAVAPRLSPAATVEALASQGTSFGAPARRSTTVNGNKLGASSSVFMADNMGARRELGGPGTPSKQPRYDPVAWPNELRRAHKFYDFMTRRRLPGRFQASPFLRVSEYTTAQINAHTKAKAEALKAEGLEVINHDLKVVDANGEPLVYFFKGGLSTPFDYQPKDLKIDPTLVKPDIPAIGLQAFQELTRVYPPPKPSSKDSRHTNNKETRETKKGLYHFAYWQQKGHDFEEATMYDLERGAALSKDAFPSINTHGLVRSGGCVPLFFQRLAPITQAIGSMFEVVDPDSYKRYRARYLELDASTPLRMFTASQHACFVGNACLVGLETVLHRDWRDTEDGWVADICFGDFDGGHLEIPQAGVELQLEPGDLVFMRSRVLYHGVNKVTRGLRYSMVSFTHAGMIDLEKIRPKGE